MRKPVTEFFVGMLCDLWGLANLMMHGANSPNSTNATVWTWRNSLRVEHWSRANRPRLQAGHPSATSAGFALVHLRSIGVPILHISNAGGIGHFAHWSVTRRTLTHCFDGAISRLPRLGSRVRIPSPAPNFQILQSHGIPRFFRFLERLKSQSLGSLGGRGLHAGYKCGEATNREIAASKEYATVCLRRRNLTRNNSSRALIGASALLLPA